MTRYLIHTEETVEGVYAVDAVDEAEALALFEQGSLDPEGNPISYEAVDTPTIERVEIDDG